MDQSKLEISLRSHAEKTQADATSKVESLKQELEQRTQFAQGQMSALEKEMGQLLDELEHSSRCVRSFFFSHLLSPPLMISWRG